MRCYMGMTYTYGVSEFANPLLEMNKQLNRYPDATESPKISSEKLVKILEFALAEVWHKHMTFQRFISS